MKKGARVESRTVCIDDRGREWSRHYWGVNGVCERCGVEERAWRKTKARRRAGDRLIGLNGELFEEIVTAGEREGGQ